jgi:glutaredoxin
MKAIIALCALLASIPVSGQQIQRWVDAEGRVQYSDKPPPGVASKPVEARINSYGGTPVVSGAPAASKAPVSAAKAADQPRAEIKMYATDWCPHCRRAQAYFARQGIRYTHIDIEKSESGRAEYRSLGGRGVPLIVVGSQRMSGFSEERFAQMLKAAGY